MTEKSLKSRMSWFNADDPEMATWLKGYAKRHTWIEDLVHAYTRSRARSDTEFAHYFIKNWASTMSVSNDDKYKVNLLRSAWRSYSNRSKTSTFSLSTNAQKSLNYLSKRLNVSKTYVVNETLVAAVKLIKDNKNKKFEANLLLPKLEQEVHVLDSLLEELLDIDELKREISALRAENANLQKLLTSKQNLGSRYINRFSEGQ
ncbi:hypothetical protein VSVS12_03647 [Vibrio scophthalmi]|uniref:hypothetical protein n=1 Tax=Vibrio scophthalmi TaxID=45658 RepID=UPI0008097136|nr:hypothetical protein [Vibrio scophthalmi]ANS87348.1 hypothetical protein VSVS12_03647 [Vibrio scophthalmi]